MTDPGAVALLAWLVAVSGSYVMNTLTTFARESGRELRTKAYFAFMISLNVSDFDSSRTRCGYFSPSW